MKYINMEGERYGRLTVIERTIPKHKTQDCAYWKCRCDCGKIVELPRSALISNNTRSCGCLNKDINRQRCLELNKAKRKYNKIIEHNETIEILCNNNKSFIIDKEDYPLFAKYYWDIPSATGYPTTQIKTNECKKGRRKSFTAHKLLFGNTPNGYEIDHIDRNKLNNRKCNLRIVTHLENMQNRNTPSNNKTGYKNIYFSNGYYGVQIVRNKKSIYLGKHKKLEDAISVLENYKKIGDIK